MFPFCRPSVVSTVPSQPFIKSSIIIDFSWRIIDYRVFKSKNAKEKVDIDCQTIAEQNAKYIFWD